MAPMDPNITTKSESIARVPKLSGADVELGNFILGTDATDGTGREASRILLEQFSGYRPGSTGQYPPYSGDVTSPYSAGAHSLQPFATTGDLGVGYNPQDSGRCYLPSNGGCAYIDLDHLEICLPETLSAYDHVASFRAMLRITEAAREAANRQLPDGRKVQVLVNNSDGFGHSYGSHLSFLVSRTCWDNIFNRKLHFMLFLASYQVSSIIFTGQGKVGSEDGQPAVRYQIAQRADFFRTLTGIQTTFNRPIVNSRDEALCGNPGSGFARLHVIFYDNTLAQTASVLKVGVMQVILTLIENQCVRSDLLLDDPVEALVSWSHDPALSTRARTVSGKHFTAIELQWLFLEEARRFERHVGFEGWVPRGTEILDLWEKTLSELDARQWPALARKLDWVLKLQFLDRALELNPHLDWGSGELKHLDHIYASLDRGEGLYWDAEHQGGVDRVIDENRIRYFMENPPKDTRAWTRAMLLRQGGESLTHMDWDSMEFRIDGEDYWPHYGRIELADPLESGFVSPGSPAFGSDHSLEDTLDILNAKPTSQVRSGIWESRVTYRAYPLYPNNRSPY